MSETRKRMSAGRRPVLLAMVIAALLTGCASGPPAPVGKTQAAVTHKTVLAEFSERMLKLGAPAVLIEARINGEAWSSAGGVRSLESRTPAEVTDPVHVASVTKSMVAVSVLKLVEEGVVRLKDPVGKHFAEFDTLLKPPGTVTVEHLLRHQSGIPGYDNSQLDSQQLQQALAQPITAEEHLANIATLPWVVMPGERMEYSNVGYIILGLMVQRLRGQPIGQVLETDIIEPLSLAGTHLASPGPAPASMVHGYITIDGQRHDVTSPGGLIGSAAGGLVSTVGELNTFYGALMTGRLLKPDTVGQMLVAPTGYGLGLTRWTSVCAGTYYYGHAGDTAGYGTIALATPDASRQVAITLAYPPGRLNLTPYAPSHELAWEIMRIARKALDVEC